MSADAKALLSDLLKIDTTNPPGNEIEAARVLGRRLRQGGIPFEILESSPGRGNLIARLKGDGSRRPLLLVSHLDVVSAEREDWSVPPFDAVEEEGALFGRGALDNKGMTAGLAAAMLEIKRAGLPLKRDLILLAAADEESGGHLGVRWLLDNHRESIDAEYALGEGGTTELRHGRVVRVSIQSAEKRYYDIRLTARGTAGHSAIPASDNAIFALSRALNRVEAYVPPVRLNPVTRAFFEGVAPLYNSRFKSAVKDLLSDRPEDVRSGADFIGGQHPDNRAFFQDTLVPTLISGGARSNVNPLEVWVNLNCRLLPDTDPDRFVESLRAVIADPAVEVVTQEKPSGRAPPMMPTDSGMYRALVRASSSLWPDAVVVPYMSKAASDAAHLRQEGILAYGIGFPLQSQDETRIHGNDERMPIESLGLGTRYIYEVIAELNK